MNLRLHLLTRIGFVAFFCLLASVGYALCQSHYQAQQHCRHMADVLAKQLESQLLLIDAGIGRYIAFPDFEFWKQTVTQPGLCLNYSSQDTGQSRSLCTGPAPSVADRPIFFENAYRWVFNPGSPTLRPVMLHNRIEGSLIVTLSAEQEIAEAWIKSQSMSTLSAITIFAVCLLVYMSIGKAFKPTQSLVTELAILESGALHHRLPNFELREWQTIATAINRLAASQQRLMEERQKLIVKSIKLQEDERRYLARELHDELGQCLAAINALAASIKYDTDKSAPETAKEAEQILNISGRILDGIKVLLSRLRPAELDNLGLAASLNRLVAGWRQRYNGQCRYGLQIDGACKALTETQALTLFRVTQECLTNVSKHAQASDVETRLNITEDTIELSVVDNGIAHRLPFSNSSGIGLLGVRERVTALGGQLKLSIASPHGLRVEIRLPLVTDIGIET